MTEKNVKILGEGSSDIEEKIDIVYHDRTMPWPGNWLDYSYYPIDWYKPIMTYNDMTLLLTTMINYLLLLLLLVLLTLTLTGVKPLSV